MHQVLARMTVCTWLLIFAAVGVRASDHRSQVFFNGLGVPGAVGIASQGDQKITAITDAQGGYVFSGLADGVWSIRVEMHPFSPIQRNVAVGSKRRLGLYRANAVVYL